MTRLLVSVTSAAEALIARDSGADLIDVKDPSRGSLGAQSPRVWREVMAVVGDKVPVSAALGELYDEQVLELASQTTGLLFAKVGLQGANSQADWRSRWGQWRDALPATVQPVLVMYADWQSCDAPSPTELIEFAAQQHVSAVLIDTCHKDRGRLRDLWKDSQLSEICGAVRNLDSRLVLAGSLQLADLRTILPLQPDYVAVRGAVCAGSRNGPVSGELIRRWAQAVHSPVSAHDSASSFVT